MPDGSRNWWAGRRVLTPDGERGTVLDRNKVRGCRRRKLAKMILAKDYLQLVQWDDGRLELVSEEYLLDPDTHTSDPVPFDLADWERSGIASAWTGAEPRRRALQRAIAEVLAAARRAPARRRSRVAALVASAVAMHAQLAQFAAESAAMT
jgi:hypothetical protein